LFAAFSAVYPQQISIPGHSIQSMMPPFYAWQPAQVKSLFPMT